VSWSFSFDPFDADTVHDLETGDSRGVALPAGAAALAFVLLSVGACVLVGFLAPDDLAPLRSGDADFRRFAAAGEWPLVRAAELEERLVLGPVAYAQTFAAFLFIAAMAIWFGRAGFLSERLRGWSNGVWIIGVLLVCLTPTLAPELTPQKIDYLIMADGRAPEYRHSPHTHQLEPPLPRGLDAVNHRRLPRLFVIERGAFVAFFGLIVAFVFHDAGYRLREALGEFGLMEEKEAFEPRRRSAGSFERARAAEDASPSGGFHDFRGEAPPPPQSPSEDQKARAVLGVSISASRREIERAFRAQMKRAHPDHGGSVERAAALNAARDLLLGK